MEEEEDFETDIGSLINNLKSAPPFKRFFKEIKKIKNNEELKDAIAEFYIDLLLNSFVSDEIIEDYIG